MSPEKNEPEAREVLRQELARWRRLSWAELAEQIGATEAGEVRGPSGALYQVEVQVFWDDAPGGIVRVQGSVDDGGWRAFAPWTDDFLVRSDGSFVGEETPGASI